MYIEVKRLKTKYQLYLCHSKRINGKPQKLINQYLCSIPCDEIEGIYNDNEAFASVIEDVREPIQAGLNKIPNKVRIELKEEFNTISRMIFDKLVELAKINSNLT